MRSGRLLLVAMLLVSLGEPCSAMGDDYKVMKLEQDVRNLERQVGELSRQLAVLQRRDIPEPAAPQAAAPASAAESDKWVNAARWERARIGMSELEVIELLGKPSSLRIGDAPEQRTLLYAMEIGSTGFLGGSIELRDRRVTTINKPVLR